MLVHIVMFQFKDENKEANMARVKEMLEALPSKINTLHSMEVGIDISRSERSYDMVLLSMFEEQAALDVYAIHQRPRNALLIALHQAARAGAVVGGVAIIAEGAGVHSAGGAGS